MKKFSLEYILEKYKNKIVPLLIFASIAGGVKLYIHDYEKYVIPNVPVVKAVDFLNGYRPEEYSVRKFYNLAKIIAEAMRHMKSKGFDQEDFYGGSEAFGNKFYKTIISLDPEDPTYPIPDDPYIVELQLLVHAAYSGFDTAERDQTHYNVWAKQLEFMLSRVDNPERVDELSSILEDTYDLTNKKLNLSTEFGSELQTLLYNYGVFIYSFHDSGFISELAEKDAELAYEQALYDASTFYKLKALLVSSFIGLSIAYVLGKYRHKKYVQHWSNDVDD